MMADSDTSQPKETKTNPWADEYTLKLGSRGKVPSTRIVLYIVQIAVVTMLEYLSVIMLGPLSYSGISLFFFAWPFIMLFTMWWGFWGCLSSYIGGVIGAGLLVGVGLAPSAAYTLATFPTLIPMFVVYRGYLSKHGVDPLFRDLTDKEVEGVKTHRARAWFYFIVINLVILSFVNAYLSIGIEYLFGLIPPGVFWFWIWGFIIGNLIPSVILMPILVRGLSSLVTRQGLVNYGWLS
jgi:hypothetical protein